LPRHLVFGKPIIFYDIHSKGAEGYTQLAQEVIDNAEKRVGAGLGALIREPELTAPATPATSTTPHAAPVTHSSGGAATAAAPALNPALSGPLQIAIDLIDPSPYQPRTRFREEALDELARSIQTSGIIQPLVVRPIGQRFQLIAGERRWRAAHRAGLNKVSSIVRQVSDELALEMTLVENIQREDLNAMEAARAFARLMDEFQLTQESVAERTGKDRATVANAIRLLKLEPTIQEWIEEGKLSAGHGRALLAVAEPQLRMRYAQRAARGGSQCARLNAWLRGGLVGQKYPRRSMLIPTSAKPWKNSSDTSARSASAAKNKTTAGPARAGVLRRRATHGHLRPPDEIKW